MFQPAPFGKYFLLERVAVGGMAEVFRGKLVGAQGVDKDVAVKLVLPQFARQRDFVEGFVEEAKLTMQLQHGNIIPVYELGEHEGVLYLAMEFVRGRNLGELLDSCVELGVRLPIPLACHLIMEVCRGLDYAHRKCDEAGQSLELVHRDISPQNILVSYEGDVKIADFGIARVQGRSQRTEAGVVKGKCGYMSPEQAEGRLLDGRTDLFATGVMLYESLTLTRLFSEETDLQTLEKVRSCDIPAPTRINPEIPPALEAVVFRALQRDREQRFATGGDMADAIAKVVYERWTGGAAAALSESMRRLFARGIAEDDARRRDLDARFGEAMRGHAAQVARGVAAPLQAPQPSGERSAPRKAVRKRARDVAGEVARLRQLAGEPDEAELEAPRGKGGLLVPLLVLALVAAVGFAFRAELSPLLGRVTGKAPPPATAIGTLEVETEPPGANVYFAGQLVGKSNLKVRNVDPDESYELVLTFDGKAPATRRVTPADWDRSRAELSLKVSHTFR